MNILRKEDEKSPWKSCKSNAKTVLTFSDHLMFIRLALKVNVNQENVLKYIQYVLIYFKETRT